MATGLFERRKNLDRLATALDALRKRCLEHWKLVLAVNTEWRSFAEVVSHNGTKPKATKQKSHPAKWALVRDFDRIESAMPM